jgi:hypothetical protein
MVAGGLAILTAGILLFAPNIIGLMTPNYVPPEELEESIEPIWGMLLLGGTLNIVLGGLIVSGACLSHFRKRNLIGGFLVLVPSALLCTAPNLAVPGLLRNNKRYSEGES